MGAPLNNEPDAPFPVVLLDAPETLGHLPTKPEGEGSRKRMGGEGVHAATLRTAPRFAATIALATGGDTLFPTSRTCAVFVSREPPGPTSIR